MAFKIFLDANILLDFLLKRDRYQTAKEVIDLSVKKDVEAYTSAGILQVCTFWLTKTYGLENAKKILTTLLIDVRLIDLPHEIAVLALHSKIKDIEDAFQYYTAIHHEMDYFITHDKKMKKEDLPELPVLTAAELLKELAE